MYHLTLKTASTQVVETSVTNHSPSQAFQGLILLLLLRFGKPHVVPGVSADLSKREHISLGDILHFFLSLLSQVYNENKMVIIGLPTSL